MTWAPSGMVTSDPVPTALMVEPSMTMMASSKVGAPVPSMRFPHLMTLIFDKYVHPKFPICHLITLILTKFSISMGRDMLPQSCRYYSQFILASGMSHRELFNSATLEDIADSLNTKWQ